MANVMVSRLFWLTVMYLLLHEVVDGFVYLSEEDYVTPDYEGESTQHHDIFGGSPTPYLVEKETNKDKKFALAVFFKTNWFRAAQYCRYRGMQLASVVTAREEKLLESQIESVGFELGPTWTSGTDLSEEGVYFWASTGTPVTFTKWGDDQPGGDKEENCLYINNDPSEGFAWHDGPCASEYYFACEFFTANSSNQSPLYV